jgi:hypothetical protein
MILFAGEVRIFWEYCKGSVVGPDSIYGCFWVYLWVGRNPQEITRLDGPKSQVLAFLGADSSSPLPWEGE